MARRWICPDCGSGVNAPDRPRRDDVRRYCLKCSEKTGRLVERACPALERQRADSKVKAAARTVRKRERTKAADLAQRTASDGVDLLAEARRFAKLPLFREKLRRFPTIEFRQSKTKYHTSGRCWQGALRIVVTVGRNPNDPEYVVLHEMVHAVTYGEGHSPVFWRTLQRAAREAWPKATFDFDCPLSSTGGRITKGIREWKAQQ